MPECIFYFPGQFREPIEANIYYVPRLLQFCCDLSGLAAVDSCLSDHHNIGDLCNDCLLKGSTSVSPLQKLLPRCSSYSFEGPTFGSFDTLTTSFPSLAPENNISRALGAFSSPSTI